MFTIGDGFLLWDNLSFLVVRYVEDIYLKVVCLRSRVVCRSRINEMHQRELLELRKVYIIRRTKGEALDEEVILCEDFESLDYVIERDHLQRGLLNMRGVGKQLGQVAT